MHDEGHPTRDHLVEVHEARVVHVHFLCVGMKFEAVQTQFKGVFNFGFHIFDLVVHGAEPEKFGVLRALPGDELVDGGHRTGRGELLDGNRR